MGKLGPKLKYAQHIIDALEIATNKQNEKLGNTIERPENEAQKVLMPAPSGSPSEHSDCSDSTTELGLTNDQLEHLAKHPAFVGRQEEFTHLTPPGEYAFGTTASASMSTFVQQPSSGAEGSSKTSKPKSYRQKYHEFNGKTGMKVTYAHVLLILRVLHAYLRHVESIKFLEQREKDKQEKETKKKEKKGEETSFIECDHGSNTDR